MGLRTDMRSDARRLVVSSAEARLPMAGGLEHRPVLELLRALLALRQSMA